MSARIFSLNEAIINYRNNNYCQWDSSNKANAFLASNRLGKTLFEPNINPGFSFSKSEKTFALGSCFARGLEKSLHGDNVRVLSITNEFDIYPMAREGLTRSGYLNKYNTFSILQEIEWAFEGKNQDGKYFVETADSIYHDLNANPTLVPADFNTMLERRKRLYRVMNKIKECRVLTITLGLIEAWYDNEFEVYLNMTPTPRMWQYHKNRFELHLIDYHENLDNLEKIYVLLKKHCRNDLQIIITVSPIPLQMTYTPNDIVVANMFSKSILRSVAEMWALKHENVHYFPSYEIVFYSDQDLIWTKDRRHLKGPVSQYVMEIFKRYYLEGYEKWKFRMEYFEKKIQK
jgi:hypothetical protein